MEARTGIAVALLLVGCTPQVNHETSKPNFVELTKVAPSRAPHQRNVPRTLKLRLTLDRPEDLKVKVNDPVAKGQVISDRSSVRDHLLQDHQVLLEELKQLNSKIMVPPASYVMEQVKVEQAKLMLKHTRATITRFKENSIWTTYAREVLPLPENRELAVLENRYQQEKDFLIIATANLKATQVKHQIVHQDGLAQRAKLLRQITELQSKLNEEGTVKSSYQGKVRSIKWLEQKNSEIQVVLTLNVDDVQSM